MGLNPGLYFNSDCVGITPLIAHGPSVLSAIGSNKVYPGFILEVLRVAGGYLISLTFPLLVIFEV